MGNSVSTIGNDAFRSSGLTYINIPKSVTAIGDQAFRLDRYASAYPALTFRNLDLSQAPLTSIGLEAFYGCSSLTGVLKLPETVTTIGTQAFFGTGFS